MGDWAVVDEPAGGSDWAVMPEPALTPSGLPRQTGKRFIEPPEDDTGPTLQDEQIGALGLAPKKQTPAGAFAALRSDQAALADRPGVGERVLRNVAQGVPIVGPFTDELSAALEAPLSKRTYREIRDEHRRRNAMALQDAPVESQITRTAAGLLPTGALFKGAQTAGQIAERALAIGAAEGAGASEANDVIGTLKDAAESGLVSGATAGLVSKLIRNAPERVNANLVKGISRGEAGGAAKDKLYKNLAVKAGDEASDLNTTLARFPGLKKVLAVAGPSSPKKAAEAVQDRLDVIAHKLEPIYDALDNGPAVPEAQHLYDSLTAVRDRVKAAGSTGMADVIERFQQHLLKHYGDGDAIKQGELLPASALRNLRREVAEVAFAGDPTANTPFRRQAQQMIYGAINDTIEDAALRTPGVDVNKLRQLNNDYSMLKTVLDPLTDRAAKAAGGRTGFGTAVMHAVAPIVGGAVGLGAHGGAGAIEGAIGAAGLLAAKKALGPVARATDYQLSRLALAARAGNTPAQLTQLGLELGLGRTIAPIVADRLARTIFPPEEGEAPQGE